MKVAVIMGSRSDLPVAEKTLQTLSSFGIEYEVRVISAHRALDMLQDYVASFAERNIQVVIALAGKAAHLPGVIAGMTTLPVIGVPIKGSAFGGLDSLMSIVQMPSGVPVATVAVDGAENAAILACQMLALASPELRAKLEAHKLTLEEGVQEQDRQVRSAE